MAKTPEFTPIESSMFSGHHYDPNTRTMTLRFKNGLVYQHDDVGADKNEAFLGNPSKGGYYNRKIKPMHPGRKVK